MEDHIVSAKLKLPDEPEPLLRGGA
jgi:hypothetical protein